MIQVIIPLMGKSLRFKSIGINQPKWAIEINNTPSLIYALDTFKNFYRSEAKFTFITFTQYEDTLKEILKLVSIEDFKIMTFDGATKGQAETAYLSLSQMHDDDYLIIWNGDSWINPNEFGKNFFLNFQFKSVVVTSVMNGNHWSFFKQDEWKNIIEVQEKRRISKFASTGLYTFSSVKLYKKYYLEYSSLTSEPDGELFVAPIYNHIIKDNQVINHIIRRSSFICFGTPEEMREAEKKFQNYEISS